MYIFKNSYGEEYRMTDEEWERQYAELKIPTILNIPKEIKTTDYYYSHYEND